jgi:hypothetical protein
MPTRSGSKISCAKTDEAAAAVEALFAAVATPPPLELFEIFGIETVGIFGIEVETLGTLISGTLTFGTDSLETFGKNGC